jgi:type II secretory pathway pseudopilin PulG
MRGESPVNLQAGFTLVEALVTGVISAALGGVILTVFLVNGNQIRETTTMLQMSQRYDVASDQIKRTARLARLVKTDGDAAAPIAGPITDPQTGNVYMVIFCGTAGDTLGGYRIGTAYNDCCLDEWSAGAWKHFEVSHNEYIKLNHAGSYFQILDKREGIQFALEVMETVDGSPVSLSTKPERIICRNADL